MGRFGGSNRGEVRFEPVEPVIRYAVQKNVWIRATGVGGIIAGIH